MLPLSELETIFIGKLWN